MAFQFDILNECTKLKGEIGELVVSSHLKKKGFIVRKPRSILALLERVGVPFSYEVEFLQNHYKTMDFFAVYPRDDELVLDRSAICEVFNGTGLNRYMTESKSKGFIVEVKTGFNGCKSRPSKKQKQMFRLGRKLEFGVIIAEVDLKENYVAEIVLKDEIGNEYTENRP